MDIVEGKLLMKLLQSKGVAYMLHHGDNEEEFVTKHYLEALQEVLAKYAEVFEIPYGLPPSWTCDHRIPLINPELSVNSRPYRYPFY